MLEGLFVEIFSKLKDPRRNRHENVKLDNGELVNAIFLGRQSATSPGFPFVVEISTKNNDCTIKLLGICRFVSRDRCESIPVI